ncbi:Hydrogenase nickel incorporation protein HypB [Aeromonas sp. RU39B]|uniref:hydrogenase nickel incorporation protein HypB n=1 Tax=Aeromonas sp. RU39B TaxID=1907416 RepID=UPI0009543083|nr:hydrogenase nickel incorporation protein HypB [Aeromonas sp. RU39B]SIR54438.1 Hydrogenase nickel incorporation protein HypB [Aeromonas sp. RU39B]
MCTVCGCGEARVADADHHHDDHHDHGHDGHTHQHAQPAQVVIHHHHYYYHQGDVHHHYHGAAASEAPAAQSAHAHHHEHEHDHPHSHAHAHQHDHGGAQRHEHAHGHTHDHAHSHEHDHPHHHQDQTQHRFVRNLHYGKGAAGVSVPGMSQRKLIAIERDVLDKNNQLAAHNREHFTAARQLVLNLVSSPGSGKTTLLCETLRRLKDQRPCAVIEGDQQTSSDAERIRATGVAAVQVNTGKGCHLDAQMVHDACHRLELAEGGVLFIENVGNLVCPAGFDLGERAKVAVLSVTEGEEKPLKYPDMFAAAELMIINKTDLLPHVSFDVARCIENARRVNPDIQVIQLSASTGEGMEAWLGWLAAL